MARWSQGSCRKRIVSQPYSGVRDSKVLQPVPRRSQRLEVLQGWERAGMLRTLLSSNKDIAIPRDLGDEAEEDPLRGALITDLRFNKRNARFACGFVGKFGWRQEALRPCKLLRL